MDRPLRIASLLPSATEVVCALGAGGELVGVSHECDHPPEVAGRPRLTRSRLPPDGNSGSVDRDVRQLVAEALSIYSIDVDALRAADPDVILTQDLCRVCAVSLGDVAAAVAGIGLPRARIVTVAPLRLVDVLGDVERIGTALGRAAEARAVVADLEARIERIRERAHSRADRPRVLTVEWLDPVMVGGTWMPELVELAGGTPLAARAGELAPILALEELGRLAPDVVLLKPCGFTLERVLAEREGIERVLRALGGTARARGRCYAADGSAYFNRPGPRLADSLAILAACVHPDVFANEAETYARDFCRLERAP